MEIRQNDVLHKLYRMILCDMAEAPAPRRVRNGPARPHKTAPAELCRLREIRRVIHSAQKPFRNFVTHGGAGSKKPDVATWTPARRRDRAAFAYLCTSHKKPRKILSRGWLGRGGICVRSAASSRKTLMQICFVSRAFRHISGLYPPFPFQPMPSEKGSRTGAGVRLRVHHVCRCGLQRSG